MRACALNPHVVAGHRACLRPVWVPCLHLPFCRCLLHVHSTFCTPPCSHPSVGFLLCFLPKDSFEMIGFGDDAHSAMPGFRPSFFVPFFASILEWFLMDFGSIVGSLFGWVFIFWLSFFEHVFCIDFSLNLGWNLVSFLMFFWYLYRSHMQPSKSSKTIVFPINFNDFTLQRNMLFDDVPDLFRYQFWHWFLMRFGIDFGSLLVSLFD